MEVGDMVKTMDLDEGPRVRVVARTVSYTFTAAELAEAMNEGHDLFAEKCRQHDEAQRRAYQRRVAEFWGLPT